MVYLACPRHFRISSNRGNSFDGSVRLKGLSGERLRGWQRQNPKTASKRLHISAETAPRRFQPAKGRRFETFVTASETLETKRTAWWAREVCPGTTIPIAYVYKPAQLPVLNAKAFSERLQTKRLIHRDRVLSLAKNSAGEIMSNIASGRQLRAARMLTGLTQARLSTEAGFGPRACRYWEGRGNNPPTSVDGSLEAIEVVLLRHGVAVFANPTPGCRLVSTK